MKPLFFTARYWPGLGGAKLHTHQIAHRLRSVFDRLLKNRIGLMYPIRLILKNTAGGGERNEA